MLRCRISDLLLQCSVQRQFSGTTKAKQNIRVVHGVAVGEVRCQLSKRVCRASSDLLHLPEVLTLVLWLNSSSDDGVVNSC